jgi:subtilisin family serine protease
MRRRIFIWFGLAALLMAGLAVGPWGASASLPTGVFKPASSDPASNLNVPLRHNWWVNIPDIDRTSKMHKQLLNDFQDDPTAIKGYMVYLKAQADTHNNITDWNAKGEYVLRQLETVAGATQPDLLSEVARLKSARNVTSVTKYTIINAVFVRGDLSAARALAQRDDVAFVDREHFYTLHKGNVAAPAVAPDAAPAAAVPDTIEPGINYVHAPQAWSMGYTGTGIVVGSIDTGVQYDHSALVRQYRGNLGGGNFDHNYNWFDTRKDAPRQDIPYDDDGHGTHTTGTILGEDATQTNQIGVAPGAKWIAAKVFPGGGSSSNEEITTAEDFMLAPWDLNQENRRPDLRPHVVGNSWGDDECWNTDSWFITQAWIDAGVMPSFSSGNSGPSPGSVGSPSAYPFLIATGALSVSSNTLAGFTGRGPSCYSGALKPDVVAPGVNIRSSVPTNSYGFNQGTSMAQPHNAGVMVLILDANPTLNYTDVKSILTRTAVYNAPSWGTRPNNNYGWGVVQADGAVNMALHGARVSGTVTVDDPDLSHAYVTVRRTSDNDTYSMQVRADGTYSMTLLAGTYVMTATAFGYDPEVVTDQVVMSDTNYTVNFSPQAQTLYPVSFSFFETGTCNPISATINIEPPSYITMTGTVINNELPAGTYTVRAYAGAKYQPITDTLTVSGPTVRNYTFGAAHDNANTYSVDAPAFNWIPATNAITLSLPNADDGSQQLTIPFAFNYYGTDYTTIQMSTNGYATFLDLTYARMWANTQVPQPGPTPDSTNYKYPNNAIYPYWDDLSSAPRTYGTMYWDVIGDKPNRVFVMEWRGVAGGGAPMTFELLLEETTNNITFQYQDVDSPYGYGYSSTHGIENASGNDGIQLGFNWKGIVGNNMALRFRPQAAPAIVACAGATATPEATSTSEATAISTPQATNTSIPEPTAVATTTPTACSVSFTDVPETNTFYANIKCLACKGILGGYSDGTFRPNNDITRGQIAKVVSNAAGFNEAAGTQIYEDVPSSNTFYVWINRLSMRGHMGGYPCGGTGEPCGDRDRPYFRPNANATRAQLAKIVASAKGITSTPTGQRYADVPPDNIFYVWIEQLSDLGVMGGYACNTVPSEPCDDQNRPYFRPFNNVTRGQASKIVANTFFPGCDVDARR